VTDYAGTYNGLSFGAGTDFTVQRLKWYRRSTQVLTPDLPRYHGGLIGASYEAARVVEVDFGVKASTVEDLVTNLDSLFSAFAPLVDSELPFVFGLPGQSDRVIFLRPQEGDSELDPSDWASKSEMVPFRLVASDPAIYDNALSSETLDVFAASAGLSYPVTYPKAYGASGSGAGTTVTNSGDWETWPVLTISGPSSGTLTNPIVENVTTGFKIALTANGGASITTGQTLIIDTHPASRSIAFSTGASRRGKMSTDSDWWPLESGNNELRFRASGTTTAATCLVEFRSARI
jgi:hypothetical protein